MSQTTLTPLNESARKFISKPKKLFIGGKWVDSVSGKVFETRNPATGEVITTVPEGTKEDIDLAVRAARQAFDKGPWRTMKPYDRSKLLLKIANLIEENAEELAHLDTLDYGAPLSMTNNFAATSAETFRYYAGWVTKITGSTIPVSTPGKMFNYTLKEPVGVCGQIIPWNAPLNMAVWKISVALATGNTVVLKPAENTPLSALRLGELIQEAGVPDGVVNIVTGFGEEAGQALVEHPLVDKIAFTGSTAVGKKIMQSAAAHVKKVSLELGGKSPHIVFADADYEKALQNASDAVMFNTGQACIAGSRLFVEKKIYDKFMSDLADYAQNNYKLGNGFDPSTSLGPLISHRQKERVLGYLDIGQEEGAEILVGGDVTEGELKKGYFVKPTVVANVSNDMRIAQEEIFGPVVSGIPFEDIDEVIELANQTTYGLGGGVNTTDLRKAHLVSQGLRTGNVWVNTYTVLDPASPFGGYKQSGLGKENGAESLDEYWETMGGWISLD